MKHFILILVGFIVANTRAQNPNRPLPPIALEYEFQMVDSTPNNYHFSFSATKTYQIPEYISGILDSAGYLAWFMKSEGAHLDLKYHADHSFFSCQKSGANRAFYKLDQDMTLLDSVFPTNGDVIDIHEQLVTPDGHTYVLCYTDTVMDLSAYTFGSNSGLPNHGVLGNSIMEFDENNSLVFYWNSTEHVHPSEFYPDFPYSTTNFDYFHANSIDIDLDGNLLVSARHTNTIYKISKVDGSILWRLGGVNSDFTFPNDNGFSGQHDFRYLGGNLYSMYDNGNFSSTPKESRAVEFELDTLNWTATRVWRYKHTPKVYGPAMGNNDLTSLGENHVSWGRSYYPEPTFSLVAANGDNLLNFYLGDSLLAYRTHALELDFHFPRQNLACSVSNGQVVLTSPNASSYLWSTGDTTQSIVVTNTGEYICWTPYGIGFLASKLFKVTDLSNPCGVNSLNELSFSKGEVLFIYDLNGRQISYPINHGLYLLVYENGSSEKRHWNGISWD